MHDYAPTEPEPHTVKRCNDCGKAHYDENFSVCRGCGELL